jgi:hypothetical protein
VATVVLVPMSVGRAHLRMGLVQGGVCETSDIITIIITVMNVRLSKMYINAMPA